MCFQSCLRTVDVGKNHVADMTIAVAGDHSGQRWRGSGAPATTRFRAEREGSIGEDLIFNYTNL